MVEQRNGRVNSGDESLFYRAFGVRGRTPILLMHGANYFDSYTPEIVERISRDYPNIEWAPVDSQHDVAHQAPDVLIAAIRNFSATA
jgi:pimeloyl-ACP methyl ester carboxylesterase